MELKSEVINFDRKKNFHLIGVMLSMTAKSPVEFANFDRKWRVARRADGPENKQG